MDTITTTPKPAIALKNIKYAAFASDETNCYEATLYVDGELWGRVSNEGRGGPDNFHGVGGRSYDDIRELDQRIADTYPRLDLSDHGVADSVPASLETVCGEIVDEHILRTSYLRTTKSKILYLEAPLPSEDAPAEIYVVNLRQKGRTWTVEQAAAALLAKNSARVILNTLPTEQALAIYRRAA